MATKAITLLLEASMFLEFPASSIFYAALIMHRARVLTDQLESFEAV